MRPLSAPLGEPTRNVALVREGGPERRRRARLLEAPQAPPSVEGRPSPRRRPDIESIERGPDRFSGMSPSQAPRLGARAASIRVRRAPSRQVRHAPRVRQGSARATTTGARCLGCVRTPPLDVGRVGPRTRPLRGGPDWLRGLGPGGPREPRGDGQVSRLLVVVRSPRCRGVMGEARLASTPGQGNGRVISGRLAPAAQIQSGAAP